MRVAFLISQGTVQASSEAALAPRYESPPKSVQTSRYAPTKIQGETKTRPKLPLSRWTRAKARFIGAVAGNIIATIMTTQTARNTPIPRPIMRPMPAIIPACQISTTHAAAASGSLGASTRTYSRRNCICRVHLFVTRHWRSYSSWRRHQTPVSLRPRGARSSRWYMPQTTSSSNANALNPGPSRLYVSQSVPTVDSLQAFQELSSPAGGRKSLSRKLYSTAPDCHSSLVCDTWKSWLKSLPNDDAHGKLQPMRCLYACSFASGARDTA